MKAGLKQKQLSEETDGSQLVEFAVAILPMFAILLFIIDMSWMIFAKATLQEAAREGVRYAVTGQGGDASVQQVVWGRAFGLIPQTSLGCYISVRYYAPTATGTPITGTGSNGGGNVVEVSINNVPINPLGPLWRSSSPLQLSAISSDVMESSPGGTPPARGTAIACPTP